LGGNDGIFGDTSGLSGGFGSYLDFRSHRAGPKPAWTEKMIYTVLCFLFSVKSKIINCLNHKFVSFESEIGIKPLDFRQ